MEMGPTRASAMPEQGLSRDHAAVAMSRKWAPMEGAPMMQLVEAEQVEAVEADTPGFCRDSWNSGASLEEPLVEEAPVVQQAGSVQEAEWRCETPEAGE